MYDDTLEILAKLMIVAVLFYIGSFFLPQEKTHHEIAEEDRESACSIYGGTYADRTCTKDGVTYDEFYSSWTFYGVWQNSATQKVLPKNIESTVNYLSASGMPVAATSSYPIMVSPRYLCESEGGKYSIYSLNNTNPYCTDKDGDIYLFDLAQWVWFRPGRVYLQQQ